MSTFGKYGFGMLGGCMTAAGILTGCADNEVSTGPLNILFIMSDDHALQAVSCCGGNLVSTPNIDRIAANGVVFANSFVANSISGPSRACMLTGKHSHANGFRSNIDKFDGSQQTFPKLLRNAGYQTALIGKWHLGTVPQGFDYWNILPGQGDYYNPDFICNGDTLRHEGYVTHVTTDLALDWLDTKRDKHKPFCLLLHHKAPHRTWMPAPEDLGRFDSVTYTLPETFYDDYSGRWAAGLQKMNILRDMDLVYDLKVDPSVCSQAPDWLVKAAQRAVDRMSPADRERWNAYYDRISADYAAHKFNDEELAEWKFQRYMRDYMSVIASLDRNIGRVLDYLETHGLKDNTLVVYTSDQGFYMGEHGWFDKRFMYEESFRTPLVMQLPGGKRGHIEQLVQNIDYAPTFLDAAGLPVPSDMHGCSLMPLLRGEQPANWRTSLYYHFYEYPGEHSVRRHEGVRDERYKLIRFYGDDEYRELYDLQNDPAEMHNLYGESSYAEKAGELEIELGRLRKLYDVPVLQ